MLIFLAEEGRKKLKMHYSSFQSESSESLVVWGKLLEQEEGPSNKEIHAALLLGKVRS